MHDESPNVCHLAIHLPGQQPVYFPDAADEEQIHDRMSTARTTLIAYFERNAEDEEARQYLYQDFPKKYTYKQNTRKWEKRQRGSGSIGRMYHCSPFAGEKYYLRLLLTVVRGATSFEHIRTVHGVQHNTFQAACQALGLLEDDTEWIQCFTEASVFSTGYSLRILFVTALLYGNVTDSADLWTRFQANICDDLPRRLPSPLPSQSASVENLHHDYGLYLISRSLSEYGKSLTEFGLPSPQLP